MSCTVIPKHTSRWSGIIVILTGMPSRFARISCDTARTMRCRLQMMIRMWRCRWCRDEKDGLGHRGQGLSWLSVRMHRGQSIGRGEAKGNHSLSYHHVQKQQEDEKSEIVLKRRNNYSKSGTKMLISITNDSILQALVYPYQTLS